jgi:hypothetical protein
LSFFVVAFPSIYGFSLPLCYLFLPFMASRYPFVIFKLVRLLRQLIYWFDESTENMTLQTISFAFINFTIFLYRFCMAVMIFKIKVIKETQKNLTSKS